MKKRNIILFIIFILMLVLNFIMPYIVDDYYYMYNFNSNSRVSNLFDIFHSLYLHYNLWGGRVLAHFFVYLFLLLPKFVFNIFNSIIFTLLVYLMYLFVRDDREDNYNMVFFIFIIMWFIPFCFGQVFLWVTGSCNYMFTSFIILLYIYQYKKKSVLKYQMFINIILGFLSGMCNENFSFGCICIIFLYMVFSKKFTKNNIAGFVSLIFGYLFLMLAPGNFVRFDNVNGSFNIMIVFKKVLFLFSNYFILIFFIMFLLFILYKYKKLNIFYLYLFIGGIITLFFMSLFPQISIRTFIGTYLIFIIIFCNYIYDFNFNYLFNIVIVFIFFISYIFSLGDFYSLRSYYNKLIKVSNSCLDGDIYYDSFYTSNYRVPGSDDLELLNCDSSKSTNKDFARYYSIKSISVVGDICEKEN